jgi:hypothetical protein
MISVNGQDNIGSIKFNKKNVREVLRNQIVIWNGLIQSCFGGGRWLDNYGWTDNIGWVDK